MELLQIKYFMKVASNESIKQTAARFRVPPSSVSVAIKKLENELGIKLFDRTPNSLKLNHNGKILFQTLEKASNDFTRTTTEILSMPEKISGKIQILILTNEKIMMDIITKFQSEHPDIYFVIQHADYLEYGVYNIFDIIVTDREIKGDVFDKVNFIKEELFLAVNSSSHLAKLNTVTYNDISNEKFILPHHGESIRDITEKIFKNHGGHPHLSITTDDYYELTEYVKAGLGISFFPYISWRKYIDERIRLIRYDKGIYRDSYIYAKKDAKTAAKLFFSKLDSLLRNHSL